ncbi:enoyl-CoA hydratase/isomerase family protein [Streptomyces sp. NPDC044780]|uniref:Enoyl-CoA hydratase/isomerase family protein n=1 Tax=Streptomyces luomodiensis TaxID=3026192 RepID=A0ABY9V2V5_9ACTN|nr:MULTISPECIES: enoyl-CoA hydratase/isomerase family protein [unclassified Streptomyces]WAP56496.1 enoyl-CoA hydratase/isomerase family protein [Streptomyces sp. S465]WNE97045.1 enoyl-CoA hydratase/isomerase family protein [Streptomyces sp. SCA4-21]
MARDFKTLHVSGDGPELHVELNSPETGNAISEEILDDLLAVLEEVHDRPDIRVVVLSGAGPDFCLGGDRGEFTGQLAEDPTGSGLRTIGGKAHRVLDALATTTAVTIARLHGQVMGAGLALALFCDLRIGASDSRFRLPELALGLPAAWGGSLPRLLHEAGAARIRELILTGNSFDAVRAEQLSILHRVVPEAGLDDAIAEWSRPVIRRSATALRATKALLNSYSAASRLGDTTLLDAELLTAVVAAGRRQ